MRSPVFDAFAATGSWVCLGCQEAQVLIFGSEAPSDSLCEECRSSARRRLSHPRNLEAAGVPRILLPHLSRVAWEEWFGRPWPAPAAALLYVWGPTGTGKSSLAAVLASEAVAEGTPVRWVDGMLVRKDLLREEKVGETALYRALLATGLLIVDEPLAGTPAPWELDQTYRLLRGRINLARPLILTGQHDPADMLGDGRRAAPWPPALVSRMLSGAVLYLGGEDTRLRGGD